MPNTTFHSITFPNTDPALAPEVAGEFNTTTAYAVKDYCTYQGVLYRCTTAHAAGAWDATHFIATSLDNEFDRKLDIPASQTSAPSNPRVGDLWIDSDEDSPIYNVDAQPTSGSINAVQSGGTYTAIQAINNQKANRSVISGDYSTSATYEVGALVMNGQQLYRCTTAITTPENWNAAHWTATSLGTEINNIDGSILDLSAEDVSYNSSTAYSTNTIGNTVSAIQSEVGELTSTVSNNFDKLVSNIFNFNYTPIFNPNFAEDHFIGTSDGKWKTNSQYPYIYGEQRYRAVSKENPIMITMNNSLMEFRIYFYSAFGEANYLGASSYFSGEEKVILNGEFNNWTYSYVRFCVQMRNRSYGTEVFNSLVSAFTLLSNVDVSLSTAHVAADAKVTGDAINEIKNSIEYEIVPVAFHQSTTYPVGWKSGWCNSNVGESISYNDNSQYYMRAPYIIGRNNYPSFLEAEYFEIIPPANYGIQILEFDSSDICTRKIGIADTTTYPEYKGITQKVDIIENHYYILTLGRFPDNNSGSFLTDEFINSIQMRFWIRKTEKKYKAHTTTGTGGNIKNRIFFSVNVDRPLSFGGEEINTTTEEIEAVLQLPDTYKISGDPVPLVLMCHGAHGYIQKSTDKWYSDNWTALCNSLSDAGFALFDANVLPTSFGTDYMGFGAGSPLAINVLKAAYDYIIKNYNVQKKILVHGTSMGGVTASAFAKAYPQICLAESSFAGRDFSLYINYVKSGDTDTSNRVAIAFGYNNYSELVEDKWSRANGIAYSLGLHKYNSGLVTLPPDKNADFQGWLDYYTEILAHNQDDVIGEYTAYRPIPYKSWNSWGDSISITKSELILQKAFISGGSAPYECVIYDTGTHNDISFGLINNMIPQLIAWFKRWLH